MSLRCVENHCLMAYSRGPQSMVHEPIWSADCKRGFMETLPCSFVYVVFMAAFVL